MRTIAELLLNHKIPGIQLSETRRDCSATLSRLMGIPVTAKQVTYKDGILSLSIPPVLKSAVLLKQNELCALLKAQQIELKEIR